MTSDTAKQYMCIVMASDWGNLDWRRAAALRISVAAVVLLGLFTACGSAPWWSSDGRTADTAPARYRANSDPPAGAGGGDGVLFKPPGAITLHIGDELDVHMTTEASGALWYPLPQSSVPSVLSAMGVGDGGSTERYHADRAGTVLLTTTGTCFDVAANTQTNGPCPVLAITVAP